MKFQPGESGNPNGRPKGTGHRQHTFNALVWPHKEQLFDKAVQLALGGNEAMLRLFIERMIPAKPVDEPVVIEPCGDLTMESAMAMGKDVLALMGNGEITPKEAASLYGVVKFFQENLAINELLVKFKTLAEDLRKQQDLQLNSFSTSVKQQPENIP